MEQPSNKDVIVVKEAADVSMKYTTAGFVALMVFVVGFVAGFAVSRKYTPSIELPVVTIQRDTTVVRDTIKGKPLPPVTTVIKRVDTLRLQINPANGGIYQTDTVSRKSVPDTSTAPRKGANGEVLIPISSKVYKTDDYRAVVSGWRPSLDTIEVYPKNTTIREQRTETRQVEKRKTWAIVAGGGAGYGTDKVFRPVASVTLGFVIKSW